MYNYSFYTLSHIPYVYCLSVVACCTPRLNLTVQQALGPQVRHRLEKRAKHVVAREGEVEVMTISF